MTDQFQIHEEKPDHHYRTEIPNIVFHLGLDIIAIAIYAYLKRIAGDYRSCYKSQKKICSELGISPATYIKYRDQLGLEHHMLGGKKLLNIVLRKKDDGNNETTLITIVNIWRDNGDYFRQDPHSKYERPPIQNLNDPHSKYECKEEPLKKNPIEETTTPQKAKAPVDVSIFDGIEGIAEKLKKCLIRDYSKDQLADAIIILKASKKHVPNPYGFIVAAIEESYPMPKSGKERATETFNKNRAFADVYLSLFENKLLGSQKSHTLSVLGRHVEIYTTTTSKNFEYSEHSFIDDIKTYLRKLDIIF